MEHRVTLEHPVTLAIDNLTVSYRSGKAISAAVRDISLRIAPTECVGIVGESGSGKTAAFMAAMGLLPAGAQTRGSVRFENVEILGSPPRALNRVRGSKIAMIFQDPMSSLTPHLKIGVQLGEVLVTHAQMSWRDAQNASLRMLERVQIASPKLRLRQYPHELSGGMRQRVMIGMGLLCQPALLIADEPTTALDVTVQAQIIEILRALRAEVQMAIVLISHDLGVVAQLADRILVMYAGRVVESAAAAELSQNAAHPYTAGLLRCVPNLRGPRLARMPSIAGASPSVFAFEQGCAFAPRCAAVRELCRTQRPLLRQSAIKDHQVACHFPLVT